MRGHLTFHWNGDAVTGYFPRSARLLSGTIFAQSEAVIRDRLAPYAEEGCQNFFHLTISLPKGRSLPPARWRFEIEQHMRDRGVDAKQLPWAAWLDTSTRCEHVHVFGVLKSFDGHCVEFDILRSTTDFAQIAFARRLGLPDPVVAAGRSHPFQLSATGRGWRTPDHASGLVGEINEVIRRFWPTSLPNLEKALIKIASPWSLAQRGQVGQSHTSCSNQRNI